MVLPRIFEIHTPERLYAVDLIRHIFGRHNIAYLAIGNFTRFGPYGDSPFKRNVREAIDFLCVQMEAHIQHMLENFLSDGNVTGPAFESFIKILALRFSSDSFDMIEFLEFSAIVGSLALHLMLREMIVAGNHAIEAIVDTVTLMKRTGRILDWDKLQVVAGEFNEFWAKYDPAKAFGRQEGGSWAAASSADPGQPRDLKDSKQLDDPGKSESQGSEQSRCPFLYFRKESKNSPRKCIGDPHKIGSPGKSKSPVGPKKVDSPRKGADSGKKFFANPMKHQSPRKNKSAPLQKTFDSQGSEQSRCPFLNLSKEFGKCNISEKDNPICHKNLDSPRKCGDSKQMDSSVKNVHTDPKELQSQELEQKKCPVKLGGDSRASKKLDNTVKDDSSTDPKTLGSRVSEKSKCPVKHGGSEDSKKV